LKVTEKPVRAQTDLGRDILKPTAERHLRLAGLEVIGPVAIAVADLDEQLILARLELQSCKVLVRSRRTVDVLVQYPLAVDPDRKRIIAAKGARQFRSGGASNLAIQVAARVVVVLEPADESVNLTVWEGSFLPLDLLLVFALIFLVQIDFLLRRIGGIESATARAVERADHIPLAKLRWRELRREVFRGIVAVQPQAVIAVSKENVRLAVAVVVNPRGRGQIPVWLARKQL